MRVHATAVAALVLAGAAFPQSVTHRFDLPTVPLSLFGAAFTADHLGPPIGTITGARVNLRFTTTSFNAANLVVSLQAPSTGVPTWQLSGASLGWSGTGTFTAHVSTTSLNGPIDFGYPLPAASLFGVTLATQPAGPLGGQLIASWFEVDVAPWTDVGGGVAVGAAPVLSGAGALVAGNAIRLSLSGARPGAVTALVLGVPRVDLPLFGGTLVPAPQAAVPGVVNAAGALDLSFTWPAGVPPGTTLFGQHWSVDPSAPRGVAASNGLGAVSPRA